jgi:hypothetical protein
MKSIIVVGVMLTLGVGARAWAEEVPPGVTVEQQGDKYTVTKAPPGEPDVTIKVDAPKGTSEQEIAAAIAKENAARDPVAQQAAKAAKEKAAEDEAHHERVAKICDSIPEKAMHDDPSLRKMCQ